MKKIISFIAFVTIIGIIITGCKKDDNTGYSTLVPIGGVTLTITPEFTSTVSMVEKDSTFNYTLTLSQAQVADVKVYVTVAAATATKGEDFDYLNSLTIPAGSTTAKGWIKVMSDDIPEGRETFSIQVGSNMVANVSYTPVTYDFAITNLAENDLGVDLAWASSEDVFGLDGDPLAGEDIATLFLVIEDASGNVVAGGSESTSATMLSSLDNGIYYITAGILSAIELGDLGLQGDIDMDLTIDLSQLGVFSDEYEFPALFPLSKASYCNNGQKLLVIGKSGNTWNVERYEEADPFLGMYGGDDGLGPDDYYDSEIEIIPCGNDYLVRGINVGFMEDFWGEEIINMVPIQITLNPDHTITIDDQYYVTTVYDGDPYDYWIVDVTGTWTESPDITIQMQYEMYNDTDGYPVAWLMDAAYGYGNGYFDADIAPGGKKSARATKKTKTINIDKEYLKNYKK